MRVSTRFMHSGAAVACLAAILGAGRLVPLWAQSEGGTVVVRVVTREGEPVLDLKPGDLTLRIDGRTREVKSLELVQPSATAAPAAAAAPATPPSTLPKPYATNTAAAAIPKGAREFVIAIDDEGIAPGREQPVRDAVEKLIASLSPNDAVGLVALKSGGLRFAPSTDHAAVRTALSKISALGSSSESLVDMGCRTKTVLASVAALLQGVSPSRTVVVFSPGVATPTGETIRTKLGAQTDAMAAMCQVHQRDLDELGRIASGSAAGIFIVSVPEALANPSNRATGEAGLENVAGVTGGEMIRLVGAGAAVERIAKTAGTYYLASVNEGVAGSRRIDARVSRDGVHVVARPVAAAASAGRNVTPRDMIRADAKFTDLPLRSAALVSRQPGSNDLKVVVLFEPDAPAVKIASAVVGLIDPKGSLKAQWTARPEELASTPIIAALTAPPGAYRIRVAAADTTGKTGMTDDDVTLQLTDAGPVKLGTMVLVGSKGMSDPKLAFTPEDALAIGLVEIYGVAKDAKVDVTFEIAKDLTGEPMGSGQGTVAAGQGEDARLAYGGFPLATLEPGDYVMRAVVKVDGKDAGVATRTLRKLK